MSSAAASHTLREDLRLKLFVSHKFNARTPLRVRSSRSLSLKFPENSRSKRISGQALVINSDDADERELRGSAHRNGAGACAEIEATVAGVLLTSGQGKVDFGLVESGVAQQQTVVFTNIGLLSLTLDISGASLPTGFAIDSLSDNELDPGESADLVLIFDSITPGTHDGTFQFATNDPDEGTFVVRVRGFIGTETDWEPPDVQNVHLVNDTDIAADLITSDPRIAGSLASDAGMTDFSHVELRYDLDGDDQADGLVTVNAAGEFVLDLRQTGLEPGTIPLRFQAGRQIEYLGESVYTDWNTPFTFVYQLPTEPTLAITDLQFVVDTGTAGDGVSDDVRLRGTVRRGTEAVPFAQVEVDFDGDGIADATLAASQHGEFTFDAAAFNELEPGPLPERLRAKGTALFESALVFGAWQALDDFSYEPIVRPAPVISGLTVSPGAQPRGSTIRMKSGSAEPSPRGLIRMSGCRWSTIWMPMGYPREVLASVMTSETSKSRCWVISLKLALFPSKSVAWNNSLTAISWLATGKPLRLK